MNMIKLGTLLAVYLVALSFRAEAQNDITGGTAAVVAAPVISSSMGVSCLTGRGDQSGYACLGLVTYGPLSTAEILTTVALLKEEIRNVEEDAYDYMAGEPMTLALQELLKEFRERHPELKEAKDKELIKFIIQNA